MRCGLSATHAPVMAQRLHTGAGSCSLKPIKKHKSYVHRCTASSQNCEVNIATHITYLETLTPAILHSHIILCIQSKHLAQNCLRYKMCVLPTCNTKIFTHIVLPLTFKYTGIQAYRHTWNQLDTVLPFVTTFQILSGE